MSNLSDYDYELISDHELDYLINNNDDDFPLAVSNLSEQRHASVNNNVVNNERCGGSGSSHGTDISEGGGGGSYAITTGGGKQLDSDVIRYRRSNRYHGESSTNILGSGTTMMSSQDIALHGNETSFPLGLKLNISPETDLPFIDSAIAAESRNKLLKNMSNQREKTKASNIPALSLKIGNFKEKSSSEGHLVTKCYFAKRKLVWEILYGELKRKIEMSWSDVEGIGANLASGILQVELNQPPLFFYEKNPTPRKHTQWGETSDFTGGQASLYRVHELRFSPGMLDKLYEKLLESDERILELSRRTCFPMDPYLHFNTNNVVQASHFPSTSPSPSVPILPHNLHYNQPQILAPSPELEAMLRAPFILPSPELEAMLRAPFILPSPELEAISRAPYTNGYPNTNVCMSVDGGGMNQYNNTTYNYNELSSPYPQLTGMMSDLHLICPRAMTVPNAGSNWGSMPGNTSLPDSPLNFSNYMAANNHEFRMMPNVTAGSTNHGSNWESMLGNTNSWEINPEFYNLTAAPTNPELMGGGMQNQYPDDIAQFTQNLQHEQNSIPHLPQESHLPQVYGNIIQAKSNS